MKPRLHGRSGDRRGGIGDAERPRDRRESDRIHAALAVAPDVREHPLDRVPARARGDAQAQRGERIERMRGRESQRDAGAVRLPLHEAVGERALGRDLGGAELAVMREQRAEHDRHRHEFDARAQREHAWQLQVRERRNEVEVPARLERNLRGRHRTPQRSVLNTSGSNASTAMTSSRASRASLSRSYSSPLITPAATPISSSM